MGGVDGVFGSNTLHAVYAFQKVQRLGVDGGSTSVPTYAASHGCVRLTVPAMNRIWSQLFIGEPFHLYR